MNPGMLNTPLQLLQITGSASGAYGDWVETTSSMLIWARPMKVSANNTEDKHIRFNDQSIPFVIREDPSIPDYTKCQVEFKGKIYNITNADPYTERDFLYITLRKGSL